MYNVNFKTDESLNLGEFYDTQCLKLRVDILKEGSKVSIYIQ